MYDNDSGGGDGNHMTEMLEWVKRMIFLGIFPDAFAAGIAGECLSEICAIFCRDGVCRDNFKSIIFRVGTEKCRTEDGAGICPGRYPAEQAA